MTPPFGELRFVPWPLGRYRLQVKREHTIDPATGIWPISEWGYSSTAGFASDPRFATGGEQVIPRTNRAKTRSFGNPVDKR